MTEYIITTKNILKKYADNIVLRDVNIHIKQGEIYGLIGKNGSGKTTLLRILTGLINEYSGFVSIAQGVNGESKIAAVINAPSLFLNMSAYENLKEQACLLGVTNNNKIKNVLELVKLDNCGNKKVKNFSLGMTQRLKLAMSLLQNPDILILDEPLNGLDPDGIADLRKLLVNLNHDFNMTIILSSHILSELQQIATSFGILSNGEIVKELCLDDIENNKYSLEELYMQYTRGGQ